MVEIENTLPAYANPKVEFTVAPVTFEDDQFDPSILYTIFLSIGCKLCWDNVGYNFL
jgi:hypothetical protein